MAACGWDGGDAIRPALLSVSRVNDWLGENLFYSPTRLAPTYDVAARSDRLPRYFISRTMPLLDLACTPVRTPESLTSP